MLYLGLAVLLGTLALSMAGYLLVLVAVAGFSVLAGTGPTALSLAGLAAVGIVLFGVVGFGSVVSVRWIENRVEVADKRPDPVEELRERYLAAELDEFEFERQLERVMGQRFEETRKHREREYERY